MEKKIARHHQYIAFYLMVLIFLLFENRASFAEDQQYHRICTERERNSQCLLSSDYIQRRDRCDAEDKGICLGVAQDGWKTGILGKNDCQGIRCTPQPFVYAALEYRSDRGVGERWQKEQIDLIVKEIEKKKDVFVYIFVHGWHHNAFDTFRTEEEASESDQDANSQNRNLRYFKFLLAKARHELDQQGKKNLSLIGIYVGWNGGPPNAVLNIGNRAHAADLIANSPEFDTDIKRISTAVATRAGNRMLMVGHSLGGRMVSRYFMAQMKQSMRGRPLGDHALFAALNPAIGADAFATSLAANPKGHKPGLILITSEDDGATRDLYPLASGLVGRAFHVGRGLVEKSYFESGADGFSTIGHYMPYQTHRLWICYRDPNKKTGETDCDKPRFKEICSSWPSPSSNRKTGWFNIATDQNSQCVTLCFDSSRQFGKCDAGHYNSFLTRYNREYSLGYPSRAIWNIETDKAVLGGEVGYDKRGSIDHNAFVQTSLGRMLIEFALD